MHIKFHQYKYKYNGSCCIVYMGSALPWKSISMLKWSVNKVPFTKKQCYLIVICTKSAV